LTSIVDVEQANRLAVGLQFVLHLGNDRQRLGPSKVDSAILQLACVEDGYRNEPACLGTSLIPGKLQHGNGAQFGAVLAVLRHLTRILRKCRQGHQQSGSNRKNQPVFHEYVRTAQ